MTAHWWGGAGGTHSHKQQQLTAGVLQHTQTHTYTHAHIHMHKQQQQLTRGVAQCARLKDSGLPRLLGHEAGTAHSALCVQRVAGQRGQSVQLSHRLHSAHPQRAVLDKAPDHILQECFTCA